MTQELSYRNRTKHDIRREVLALLSQGAQRPTRVMGIVGLSYDQLKRFENDLITENKLVAEVDGFWQITESGRKKLALLTEALA